MFVLTDALFLSETEQLATNEQDQVLELGSTEK